MSNYLEIRVPLRQNAEWFVKLREAMEEAHVHVHWQRSGTHHITVAFINGDEQVDALSAAFERCLYCSPAPSLTFDKIDVFEANNRSEFIVNLTSSQPSHEFTNLVKLLRQTALDLGAEIESDFRLHVTLGRIDANAAALDGVKRVADSIQVPPFTLQLTDAKYRYFRADSISSWELDEKQPEIQTSCGKVKKVKGQWLFQISKQDENLVWIPFTDHWTADTCILRHNGKYGIFSLLNMSDYGHFVNPAERRSLDEKPFPYDEIKICGMEGNYFGMMVYRKGNRWGASYFYYVPVGDYIGKSDFVPCRCFSMEKVLGHLLSWKNPYDSDGGFDKNTNSEESFLRINGGGDWNYRKINEKVMSDTKKQYETMPELQSAVDYSIAHQFMVAQEENIDQPAVTNSQTQYIASGKRSFEAAKAYKGKKIAVLNFANSHAIGGAPFSAGAQEESLCRCSTLLPCLEAMKESFYKKHSDDYAKGLINAMGNDDLIYTPDVVVFKTDERTDPIYPRMMEKKDWYKVDVITCAAPEMRHHDRFPENYEEIIRCRIKKILDVAAKEKVEVLILGAWGCGAFENDIQVVSNAFYDLLKNYNFEMVEFALGSTRFIDNFSKGTKVE